jgi:hypothetical protein
MPIDPIKPLGNSTKPMNHGPSTPVRNSAEFIEGLVKRNEIDSALNLFKGILSSRTPDFAEKVLEGAPFFSAIVAKMAVDRIAQVFELEDRERAYRLQKLAQENVQRTKRVLPV